MPEAASRPGGTSGTAGSASASSASASRASAGGRHPTAHCSTAWYAASVPAAGSPERWPLPSGVALLKAALRAVSGAAAAAERCASELPAAAPAGPRAEGSNLLCGIAASREEEAAGQQWAVMPRMGPGPGHMPLAAPLWGWAGQTWENAPS